MTSRDDEEAPRTMTATMTDISDEEAPPPRYEDLPNVQHHDEPPPPLEAPPPIVPRRNMACIIPAVLLFYAALIFSAATDWWCWVTARTMTDTPGYDNVQKTRDATLAFCIWDVLLAVLTYFVYAKGRDVIYLHSGDVSMVGWTVFSNHIAMLVCKAVLLSKVHPGDTQFSRPYALGLVGEGLLLGTMIAWGLVVPRAPPPPAPFVAAPVVNTPAPAPSRERGHEDLVAIIMRLESRGLLSSYEGGRLTTMLLDHDNELRSYTNTLLAQSPTDAMLARYLQRYLEGRGLAEAEKDGAQEGPAAALPGAISSELSSDTREHHTE